MKIPDSKPKHYFPVSKHAFSFSAGLNLLDAGQQNILEIDEHYPEYIHQKNVNRKTNFKQYVCEHKLDTNLMLLTIEFLISQLKKEWPNYFIFEYSNSTLKMTNRLNDEVLLFDRNNFQLLDKTRKKYSDALDAILSQLQEDIGIIRIEGNTDYLAYLHLNFPNFWAAEEKIGNSFLQAHAPVPDMEKINLKHQALNATLCTRGPFERFTWGLTTNTNLNQHPYNKNSTSRKFDISENIYMRIERQVTVPLPAYSSYLFFIRTYFENILNLNIEEKNRLVHSLHTMTEDITFYKGLANARNVIIDRLEIH